MQLIDGYEIPDNVEVLEIGTFITQEENGKYGRCSPLAMIRAVQVTLEEDAPQLKVFFSKKLWREWLAQFRYQYVAPRVIHRSHTNVHYVELGPNHKREWRVEFKKGTIVFPWSTEQYLLDHVADSWITFRDEPSFAKAWKIITGLWSSGEQGGYVIVRNKQTYKEDTVSLATLKEMRFELAQPYR